MAAIPELTIYAERLCDPLLTDYRRGEAARFYCHTVLDLNNRDERPYIKDAIQRIGYDLPNFMMIAQDRSESLPVRILTMGMAIGNTFSNLSYAGWKFKRSNLPALLTSKEAFKTAVTPIGLEASAKIDFATLMQKALFIAEHPAEDPTIRKGAIILFNKIARIGNASFGQEFDRNDYYDRFIGIAEQAMDPSLRRCALKIGAYGDEPTSPARSP